MLMTTIVIDNADYGAHLVQLLTNEA